MPKAQQNQQNILWRLLVNGLSELIIMEKQTKKVYHKLEKASLTPELTKALTPEISDQPQHLARLKLIIKSIKLGRTPETSPTVYLPQLKVNTKKSVEQDLHIISHTLKWQNLKLAKYEFLYPLAKSLSSETEASLIEQTINDNRNTNTWLREIIKNIIVPILQNP